MQHQFTQETLNLARSALATANERLSKELSKTAGITTGLGLVAYDLEAPSKFLVPVLTPLRNRTKRTGGGVGTAVHWKGVTGINTTNLPIGISEGQRGGVQTTTEVDYLASYVAIGIEDSVTFEADEAAETFQDVKALAALNALRSCMIGEEQLILGGNTSNPLGTTPTPTVTSAHAPGVGNFAASTAYSVIAVALTMQGLSNSTVAGGLPTGAIARANADGTTTNINPGVSIQSASGANTTGGAASDYALTATVTAVPGAAAYAWYAGVAGSERLTAITTVNKAVINTIPLTPKQLATALSGTDLSAQQLVFDGLLTFAFKAGSNSYIKSLDGAALTSDTAGGVVEINTMFQSMWDNYRLGPNALWVNSQEALSISKIVIANSGAPLYRLTQDATGNHSVTGGFRVSGLLNKFTNEMVEVNIHPNQVAGTILATTDQLPYPTNNVGIVNDIKTRREYYQLEWPLRTRKYEYGVYASEVLRCFFTPSLGVIYNAGPA